ncbi:Serine/threonine-protein kinase PrkC [Acidipropionibacterium virtanenii]|uniref:Serine/threonine-protein kinase PrkC n=1 Tax=Acidipropionibacterium virtanenii TaxID=2057246 RepID=A0A344UQ04_9ACTN|nr:Serine/threonine-protein kinase PrkC [Acidipropionibacterium virtanenii]
MDSAFDDWQHPGAPSIESEYPDDEAEETRSNLWSERPSPADEDVLPPIPAGTELGGRFRLEQKLGQPLGTLTWRAFDLVLHRPVLVHIMAADGRHTLEVLSAARRAAIATDSRFLRVLDAVEAGPEDPGSFVVCEYAPGRSIEELLASGPLSALEAAWIVRELADALAPLHAQGIFHERLNPDNIIVTSTGNVKIVGLLIEGALHPWTSDRALTWSEREARDVTDMGRLLYACLVSRWPAGTLHRPAPTATRTRWGLDPAPLDRHGWLTPRQVRSGVSPALDTLCDQILSEVPRHDEVPVRTANEVAQALSRVLGSADAAADLERRLRYPVGTGGEGSGPDPAARQFRSDDETPTVLGADDPTRQLSADDYDTVQFDTTDATLDDSALDDGTGTPGRPLGVDEEGYWSPEAAAGEWAHVAAPDPQRSRRRRNPSRIDLSSWAARRGATGRASAAPGPEPAARGSQAVSSVPHNLSQPRPAPRRWLFGLAALVVLTLLVSLIVVGVRRNSDQGSSGSREPATTRTVAISSVDDFDPEGDGGNDEENPNQVALAWDGKEGTAWKTLVYLGSPQLGQLKPGVGLVVDLGERHRFTSVQVTVDGGATDVGLWVPASASARQAPMNAIKSWSRIAGRTGATATVTLKPSSATTSRYLLVYLTKLPKVSQGRYQGGIAEIRVTS